MRQYTANGQRAVVVLREQVLHQERLAVDQERSGLSPWAVCVGEKDCQETPKRKLTVGKDRPCARSMSGQSTETAGVRGSSPDWPQAVHSIVWVAKFIRGIVTQNPYTIIAHSLSRS